MSDEQVNVSNETGVSARVNAPYETQLWDNSGRAVTVSSEDIEYWMARGFRRNKLDPTTTRDQLMAAMDAAKVAIAAFVDGVLSDGVIDPTDDSAMLTANIAMAQLADLYVQLVSDISALYPVRDTGETVELIDPEGNTVKVQADQADMYVSERGHSNA